MTRNGKIARLPLAVRAELNQRLLDGEAGNQLVDWLNARPEVEAIIAGEFGGHPLREQNLSRWKNGGYREWLREQKIETLARKLGEENAAEDGARPTAQRISAQVAVYFAELIEKNSDELTLLQRNRLICKVSHELAALSRCNDRNVRQRVAARRPSRKRGVNPAGSRLPAPKPGLSTPPPPPPVDCEMTVPAPVDPEAIQTGGASAANGLSTGKQPAGRPILTGQIKPNPAESRQKPHFAPGFGPFLERTMDELLAPGQSPPYRIRWTLLPLIHLE
jgi:hypothetical protein